MSSQVEPSQDHSGVPGAGPEPPAERDHRTIDLIALVCILAACTAICLAAGTGALQAVIGAAGVLFAAWRTPPRTRWDPRSVPARRRPPRRPET
ncbi:hypothetical protein ACIRPX_02450 [Streptomyces sp. NPDC101225]|uniref:hypothetical protein n=1 Tax=Streptomyces sp. NPDC101225 TaxID=3366135 RepID=UPI0037FC5CB8